MSGTTAQLEQLEQQLECAIENVRQVRIVVSDFQPQGQPALNQKLQQICRDLAEIDKLRPSVSDIQVPLEVFDYIDAGRNPQLFTKDCMEKAHSKNEEVKGKITAYRTFKARLLVELSAVFPSEMKYYRAVREERASNQ
jgi:mediator of RNA polymerase II transcription subunit 10